MDLNKLRQSNLEITRKKIREAVNEDNFIVHAINCLDETDKSINMLSKRLREWYSLQNPELKLDKNEKYAELIVLDKENKKKDSMGKDLKKEDNEIIKLLAKKVQELFSFRMDIEKYLDKLIKKYCPNLQELAGTTIGARLIEHTGSLKKLALMPASTIQILGAEKALFRHLTKGSKPPKHGILYQHQYVQTAKRKEQGKKARRLADKIAIGVRADFFTKRFIADKLKEALK